MGSLPRSLAIWDVREDTCRRLMTSSRAKGLSLSKVPVTTRPGRELGASGVTLSQPSRIRTDVRASGTGRTLLKSKVGRVFVDHMI
jgi:hypothetical protein